MGVALLPEDIPTLEELRELPFGLEEWVQGRVRHRTVEYDGMRRPQGLVSWGELSVNAQRVNTLAARLWAPYEAVPIRWVELIPLVPFGPV